MAGLSRRNDLLLLLLGRRWCSDLLRIERTDLQFRFELLEDRLVVIFPELLRGVFTRDPCQDYSLLLVNNEGQSKTDNAHSSSHQDVRLETWSGHRHPHRR